MMQQSLELSHDVLRLVRIGKLEGRQRTDDFLCLRELVLRNEEAYPQIGRWFDSKVFDGLCSGERLGLVALLNERPIAAAILKRGPTTKFCHLKIEESVRSRSLGDLFFTLMALDVRHTAKRVRFTLPESVWEDRKAFFRSFAFSHAERAGRQYRLFDTELYSETNFAELFRASKQKLPGLFGQLAIGHHALLSGAVLAVQPKPLEQILSGIKKVEVRTRFSKRWDNRRVSLYATHPISGLAGEATISRVIEGHPNKIWEYFGNSIGCSRSEYDTYVANRESIFALMLTDVSSYPDPVPLVQLSHLLGINLPPPQSYLSLENNDGWLSAVVLAAALQGSIRVASRPIQHQSWSSGEAGGFQVSPDPSPLEADQVT
jgi:predicted transcriptional regulator